MARYVRIWDLPTRLFHWLLVLLFGTSWWSAEYHHMDWHYRSGLALLGLILFRLCWGFVGSSTARFSSFVRSPRTVLVYIRGEKPHGIGHNPVGGYSVIAMLCALVLQISTGLFSTDVDGLESGPLSYLVSFNMGRMAANVHAISFKILICLVFIHVSAIIFYLYRRINLIIPMIIGGYYSKNCQDEQMVRSTIVKIIFSVITALFVTLWIARGMKVGE